MAENFDPSGANNMAAIRDRITKTLSDATASMSPLETFANVGRAAARAATSDVTFGDALNAQKAERLNMAKEMTKFLREERAAELAEKQFGLSEKRFGLEARAADRADTQLDMDQERLGLERQRVGLQEQEGARADERLALDRDELTYQKLQDASDRRDADAAAVVDALNTLVPEEQRATYAGRLSDLPYQVDRFNVVQAIGSVRRKLMEEGGIPASLADNDDEASLRKEYTSLSKDFIQVRDSFGTILGLADQLNENFEYVDLDAAGPGDLSFIFAYMKMLDPGSTVREGEAATAEQARGVPASILNLYNRIRLGARLTPEQRRGFITQAESVFKQRANRQAALEEGFGGIAERRGFDRRNVIVDFSGPLRYRAMSNDDLRQAIQGATTAKELDAIQKELDRRTR